MASLLDHQDPPPPYTPAPVAGHPCQDCSVDDDSLLEQAVTAAVSKVLGSNDLNDNRPIPQRLANWEPVKGTVVRRPDLGRAKISAQAMNLWRFMRHVLHCDYQLSYEESVRRHTSCLIDGEIRTAYYNLAFDLHQLARLYKNASGGPKRCELRWKVRTMIERPSAELAVPFDITLRMILRYATSIRKGVYPGALRDMALDLGYEEVIHKIRADIEVVFDVLLWPIPYQHQRLHQKAERILAQYRDWQASGKPPPLNIVRDIGIEKTVDTKPAPNVEDTIVETKQEEGSWWRQWFGI